MGLRTFILLSNIASGKALRALGGAMSGRLLKGTSFSEAMSSLALMMSLAPKTVEEFFDVNLRVEFAVEQIHDDAYFAVEVGAAFLRGAELREVTIDDASAVVIFQQVAAALDVFPYQSGKFG